MMKFTSVVSHTQQLQAIQEQATKNWALVFAYTFECWNDGNITSYVALTFEKEL